MIFGEFVRRKRRGRRRGVLRLVGSPVAAPLWLAAWWVAVTGAGPVSAQVIAGMPDIIVCSVRDPTGGLPWEKLVFYVSARTVDDRTLYKTLTSDPVVLLVSDAGVVEGTNLADCDGRHVDSLREAGRAFVIAPARPR